MIRRRLALGAVALPALLSLTACASWRQGVLDTDYREPDAGTLVLGLGAQSWLFETYALKLRLLPDSPPPDASTPGTRTASQRPRLGQLTFKQQGWFGPKAVDFDNGQEHGVVMVASLPPGHYEFYNFEATERFGADVSTFTSPRDFVIGFTIQPGQTTYLGHYLAYSLPDRYFASRTPSMGTVFVISDRAHEDLGIARRQHPKLPAGVLRQVPDPDRLGSEIFHHPGQQPRTVSLSMLKSG